MFYSKERELHHKLQWSVELRSFSPPLPAEYEAELPPFPEGYKVKQEATVTVSITQPDLPERLLHKNSADGWWAADTVVH